MTDNEIIKALECCFIKVDCTDCPCYEGKPFAEDCLGNVAKQALDLITRQKAEIERLNEKLKTMQAYIEQNKLEWSAVSFIEYYRKLKAEAIKEFAERVKENFIGFPRPNNMVAIRDSIDNLVKEMVGDV